jgi:membrane protease YdiL (CAAX protease family)
MIAVVLFVGLLFIPAEIPYRVLALAFAAVLWTFLEARSLEPIGLGRHPIGKTLVFGFMLAVGITVAGQILEPAVNWIFGVESDLSGYGALKGNAKLALTLLAYALTSAALGEEILFRGFLQHQLTAIFGAGDRTRWAIIAASGILFGLAHSMQGPAGIVLTGLVGVAFSWAWFRSGRNLWALMLAHALIDSFGIAMLYLGWSI